MRGAIRRHQLMPNTPQSYSIASTSKQPDGLAPRLLNQTIKQISIRCHTLVEAFPYHILLAFLYHYEPKKQNHIDSFGTCRAGMR